MESEVAVVSGALTQDSKGQYPLLRHRHVYLSDDECQGVIPFSSHVDPVTQVGVSEDVGYVRGGPRNPRPRSWRERSSI